MSPSLGRIVLFTFSKGTVLSPNHEEGQSRTVPAIIVGVYGSDIVNLRVFSDGPYNPLWVTSVSLNPGISPVENTWQWPPRVE